MKSAWDIIFNSDDSAPLTDEESAQALTELARAVTEVEAIQASPEHGRIAKLIQEKLGRVVARP